VENDYPAAHSHDTLWFAVDRAGHVGVFWSGSIGHSPESAEGADLAAELWLLRHPGEEDAPQRDLDRTRAGNHPQRDRERAAELGFFFYDFGRARHPLTDWSLSLWPYDLTLTPETPLHVDQLPPALRQRFKRIRFEKVDFAQAPLVQPMEEHACDYRYKVERVAYLCGDGKTVRPIPGKEDGYRDFCRDFREQHPEQAKGLIFEGLDDEPATRGGE
jgi:hypothetical protein